MDANHGPNDQFPRTLLSLYCDRASPGFTAGNLMDERWDKLQKYGNLLAMTPLVDSVTGTLLEAGA
jgi:hypothetical protein